MEELGPRSRHWKRLARQTKETSPGKKVGTVGIKREGPMPLQELDPNIQSFKKSKGKDKESKPSNEENKADGGGCGATPSSPISVLAWNFQGLGSSPAVCLLTKEVRLKYPTLVFLAETKA